MSNLFLPIHEKEIIGNEIIYSENQTIGRLKSQPNLQRQMLLWQQFLRSD